MLLEVINSCYTLNASDGKKITPIFGAIFLPLQGFEME